MPSDNYLEFLKQIKDDINRNMDKLEKRIESSEKLKTEFALLDKRVDDLEKKLNQKTGGLPSGPIIKTGFWTSLVLGLMAIIKFLMKMVEGFMK